MEAKALSPRDLFDGKVCYEVPPFQRPYVWTEEDQWQPLWDDITRVAEQLLEMGLPAADSGTVVPTHFLGAVVVKQLPSASGDPSRFSVIDGQQRLTTLQLMLDAAQGVVADAGSEEDAESLQELVFNDAKRFRGSSKRFKLWPSRVDRLAFEHVMDNDLTVPTPLMDGRIFAAHEFFREAIRGWAGSDAQHLHALVRALQQSLQIVSIDLSGNDDDQLIFETLNDRGTPLLAADLIKNFVFQRCEDIGADVDAWNDKYWGDFDEDWWRDQVAQGRHYRSRIDLFLQYWLTMQVKEEIPTDAVFAKFRLHASDHLKAPSAAEAFMTGLRADADIFRDFADLDPESAPGSFYHRVVESLELGSFIPMLLWLVSRVSPESPDQANMTFSALESWAVRRTLLRYTMKDVNKLVVAVLREIEELPREQVGNAVVAFLRGQDADARLWPTDEDVIEQIPTVRAYGNIKQSRLRAVLSTLELKLRSDRHEAVSLPEKLDVEHIMPQGWRNHWVRPTDPAAEVARDRRINTLGNLTLVTQKLNVALSNRPWTDGEAAVVAPSGKDAKKGKRSLLNRFSVLLLNKDIVDSRVDTWTDEDIEARSRVLAQLICSVWPR